MTSSGASGTTGSSTTTPSKSLVPLASTGTTIAPSVSGDPSSLSGYVFINSNNNGVMCSGDWGVGTAVVELLEPSNPSFSLTYTTGTNGFYQFPGLSPGLYTVETAVLSQIFQSGQSQVGWFVSSGGDPTLSSSDYGTASTSGGMYLVSGINMQDGLAGVDYNFLESALQPDQVSKRLFLASATSETTSPDGVITGPTYWVNGSATPAVPEPGALTLLGAGGIAGGLVVWRRKATKRRGKQGSGTG